MHAGRVVHDVRTRGDRRPRDLGVEGVDRDRRAGAAKRLDDGHHPVDLLGDRDRRARTESRAAHVDPRGTVGDGPPGRRDRLVEPEGRATVVERVGRAIHDGHDRDRATEVDFMPGDAANGVREVRVDPAERPVNDHADAPATSSSSGTAGSTSRAGSTTARERMSR